MRFAIPLLFIFSVNSLAQMNSSVCVDLKIAPLRKDPKMDAKTIVEYSKYTPLKLTGKKDGRFVQVTDQRGRTGWLRMGEVSSDYSCLSVKVDKSRMRKGPGSDFPRADVAQRGDGFLDLGGEDGWTKVESADGTSSWIRLEHTWKPRSKVRMSFDGK
jgi:hypothetical protein